MNQICSYHYDCDHRPGARVATRPGEFVIWKRRLNDAQLPSRQRAAVSNRLVERHLQQLFPGFASLLIYPIRQRKQPRMLSHCRIQASTGRSSPRDSRVSGDYTPPCVILLPRNPNDSVGKQIPLFLQRCAQLLEALRPLRRPPERGQLASQILGRWQLSASTRRIRGIRARCQPLYPAGSRRSVRCSPEAPKKSYD